MSLEVATPYQASGAQKSSAVGPAAARPVQSRRRRTPRAGPGGSPPGGAGMAHLRAGEVGHVEHVHGLLAEGRDMGRGDVEVELPERGREIVEQARPVEARSTSIRCGGSTGRCRSRPPGAHVERPWRCFGGRLPATSSAILTSPFSARSIARRHALGPAQLVLVPLEGAGDEDGVERQCRRWS